MTDTFRRVRAGEVSEVNREVKTCGTCEWPMVTRRHYAEMTEVDRARHRPHGSHGNCRSCTSRLRFANGAKRKSRATGKKRYAVIKAEAWREEWDHLRKFGTPINRETARRLGISEATLTAYEEELTTRRTA
jgi:hypothetical protein